MKRPIPVTILGCLFIIVGLVGLAYHLSQRLLDWWTVAICAHAVLLLAVAYFLLTPPDKSEAKRS